jgi:Family of unknown function (DUF6364)
MPKTKFTVRVDSERLEGARQYADQHGTTVTRLVSEFFGWLAREDRLESRRPVVSTPVLHRLTGLLPADVAEDEYVIHMRQKYDA